MLLAALDLGQRAQLVLEARAEDAPVGADLVEERPGDAVLLAEQRHGQVLHVHGLVVAAARLGLGVLERFLGLGGEPVGSHGGKLRTDPVLASGR